MQVYFDKMAAFGFKSFPNQERFFLPCYQQALAKASYITLHTSSGMIKTIGDVSQ